MSSDIIKLSVKNRDVVGKKIKQLRAQNLVPGVIYNRGEAVHVSVPTSDLRRVWNEAGKHHAIELDVEGNNQLALVKEVDFEPLRHEMRHVVFGAVRRDEKTEAQVPVVVEGEIPAERAGLIVLRQLDQVEVKAFPQDIPDQFVIDGSTLAELHDKVVVGDLKIPANVEIITEATLPIVIVDEPRAHAAAEAEEEAETEGEATDAADVPSEHGSDEAADTSEA